MKRRRRRNPSVGGTLALGAANAAAPLLPVVLLGLGAWYLWNRIGGLAGAAEAWKTNVPEWDRGGPEAQAEREAAKQRGASEWPGTGGAVNPMTGDPWGPYLPPGWGVPHGQDDV